MNYTGSRENLIKALKRKLEELEEANEKESKR